ncbi:MAG: phosphoribosylformylglycinamidine synthase subunit PurL [Coriobacteriales bacterium]|jgi:phosphoribosylformylglycinamidine synthase|nr:phosphoribosylformylglycinamidine synthase subunit PurL [Coriobacteriales bacterium]
MSQDAPDLIDQSAIPAPVAEGIESLEPELARELAVQLGLKPEEFDNVVRVQGRLPSLTELYIYSLMWSEHCSYKHSKKQLRKFTSSGTGVLQGPGENAGVISVGDGWAVAFKMESHNHPSAIEPFEGAATGVGGIIRDIFTMGARPIACLDSLRFGTLDKPRQRYLFDGAVAGIGAYGNCLGVPTVGGEVYFEQAYEGNCLINAMAVGLMRESELTRAVGSGPGNHVVLLGSSTGRDGIGGASVLASQEFDEAAEDKRPAVQVGDPFEEKLLIEVCLELLKQGKFVALGDLGAAGLTSSASEMASRGGVGIDIDVHQVPQREDGMQAFEIMVSESQERMLAVVEPADWPDVQAVCERWDVTCTIIGTITDTGRFVVRDSRLPASADIVADMPAEMLAASAPEYDPISRRPTYLDELQNYDLSVLLSTPPRIPPTLARYAGLNASAEPSKVAESTAAAESDKIAKTGAAFSPTSPSSSLAVCARALLASPNICSRAWIWQQYDHQVMNNTVILPGADAAVLRIGDTGRGQMSRRGIAMSTDCNGRYCYLDPYRGAQLALAEATRNLACVGAEPAAITDCLNFGNPEKPEVFYTFERAVSGLADACEFFGIPVISGNVSFYNESFGNAIYPTPAIGIVGTLEDVAQAVGLGFKQAGDVVLLIGETNAELGGSEYLKLFYDVVAGCPPALDLEVEAAVQAAVREGGQHGLLASAHDCSEGGLFVTLAECCIAGNLGASVVLDDNLDAVFSLFAESASRIVVSSSPEQVDKLLDILAKYEVPYAVLGEVGGSLLSIDADGRVETGVTGDATNTTTIATAGDTASAAQLEIPLDELHRLYNDSLAQAMGA